MRNEEYASLLDNSERAPVERMEAIAAIIGEELQRMTEGLAMDIESGEFPISMLNTKAREKFEKMNTGFEEKYRLDVSLAAGTGARRWDVKVRHRNAGYLDRITVSHLSDVARENIGRVTVDADSVTAGTIMITGSTRRTDTVWNHPPNVARWFDSIHTAPVHIVRESPTVEFIQNRDATAQFRSFNPTWGEARIAPAPPEGYWVNHTALATAAPAVLTEAAFEDTAPPMEVDLGELRHATWDARSLTEDMQESTQRRVIEDIQRGIRRIADSYREAGGVISATEQQLIRDTENHLQQQQNSGRIADYRFESFRANPAVGPEESITMHVSIQLPQSTERINISVSLVP